MDVAEGIAQLHEGLAAYRAIGAALGCPCFLGLLAQAYGRAGQADQGLAVLDEALTTTLDAYQSQPWRFRLQAHVA